MTGKKHEVDGETFIVSEGVDLDQLDLENMVNNDSVPVPEILKTQYAQPPIIENIPGMVPKAASTPERIWLELTLDVNGTLEQFPGYVEEQSVSPYATRWALRMDRSSAMHLMMVVTNSAQHTNESAFCTLVKWVYGEEEQNMELVPPRELRMFKIVDTEDAGVFVQVSFEINKP